MARGVKDYEPLLADMLDLAVDRAKEGQLKVPVKDAFDL